MRRRAFLGLVGGAAVWPIPARAEQQRSLPRIGYLGLGTAADPRYEGEFLAGLRDLGYVEGKTTPARRRGLSAYPRRACGMGLSRAPAT